MRKEQAQVLGDANVTGSGFDGMKKDQVLEYVNGTG